MPLFYGIRGTVKKCKQLNKNKMQELKIYDSNLDTNIGLNNMAEFDTAVEMQMENESENKNIVVNIYIDDAKQIISFLQNHFNI